MPKLQWSFYKGCQKASPTAQTAWQFQAGWEAIFKRADLRYEKCRYAWCSHISQFVIVKQTLCKDFSHSAFPSPSLFVAMHMHIVTYKKMGIINVTLHLYIFVVTSYNLMLHMEITEAQRPHRDKIDDSQYTHTLKYPSVHLPLSLPFRVNTKVDYSHLITLLVPCPTLDSLIVWYLNRVIVSRNFIFWHPCSICIVYVLSVDMWGIE